MSDDNQQQQAPESEFDLKADYLIKGQEVQALFDLINKLSAMQGVSWADVNPHLQSLSAITQRPAPKK